MTQPGGPTSKVAGVAEHPVEFVIGVCGMAKKTRSRSMQLIIAGMLSRCDRAAADAAADVADVSVAPARHDVRLRVEVFEERVILLQPTTEWPACDALLAIDSSGFPLEKAIQYEREARASPRHMVSLTDLQKQLQMRDRRYVYRLLAHAGVPIPPGCIFLCGGRSEDPSRTLFPESEIDVASEVTELECGELVFHPSGRRMRRPLVEKPVDAEDHNVCIYGREVNTVRCLFRKTRTRSSRLDELPSGQCVSVRGAQRCGGSGSGNGSGSSGSAPEHNTCAVAAATAAAATAAAATLAEAYIYEPFVSPANGQDVKVYAAGASVTLASLRKSPCVDGVVERTPGGRERRGRAALSAHERRVVAAVVAATGQFVCGLDLLRPETGDAESMVIDVNGVSFVKDDDDFCRRTGAAVAEEAWRRWRSEP